MEMPVVPSRKHEQTSAKLWQRLQEDSAAHFLVDPEPLKSLVACRLVAHDKCPGKDRSALEKCIVASLAKQSSL